jgi:hypothetical protein
MAGKCYCFSNNIITSNNFLHFDTYIGCFNLIFSIVNFIKCFALILQEFLYFVTTVFLD